MSSLWLKTGLRGTLEHTCGVRFSGGDAVIRRSSVIYQKHEQQVSSRGSGLPAADELPQEVWNPKKGLFGLTHPFPWKKSISE